MKDIPLAQGPDWFEAQDCVLADLADLCAQTTTAAQVPHAAEIIHQIPIYDVTTLPDPADRALRAEWARVFRTGAGVLVLRGAYADTAPIDAATAIYMDIIAAEKLHGAAADHFAAAGANDRIWNSLQKLCEADPATYARYFGNIWVQAASEAWLGPNYQMTAQVNLVHPGGAAQQPHRDYHLGFVSAEDSARYPAHVHDLSPVMTLQGGIAHCDMEIEAGPTKLLPFSQTYRAGYAAYRLPEFRAYFEEHFVQLPLTKGDVIFFNPALFHAGGHNQTANVERFVNLLQVGSAFGRSIESVNRQKMCALLYPVLRAGVPGMTEAEVEAAIAATAEGYSFPTNLDRDPPVGGLAPKTQASLLREALADSVDEQEFIRRLAALAERQVA